MSINLKKGQQISLEKVSPGLEAVFIGLGWDVKSGSGPSFDIDSSVFLVDENEKLVSDKHFIYYNNLKSPEASVEHMGDNRTGAGEGDDEVVLVNLTKVPPQVQKIIFTVTIYEGEQRQQSFGQIQNAYVRMVDVKSKNELLRYDLDEEYSSETAMMMAELHREGDKWGFGAIGEGYAGGLEASLQRFN